MAVVTTTRIPAILVEILPDREIYIYFTDRLMKWEPVPRIKFFLASSLYGDILSGPVIKFHFYDFNIK